MKVFAFFVSFLTLSSCFNESKIESENVAENSNHFISAVEKG